MNYLALWMKLYQNLIHRSLIRLEGTLPLEPWHIGGPVVKGFGRGSKVLGIPTANISTEGYSNILSEYPSGVYWAGPSTRVIVILQEPWIPHDFDEDFYGEELCLNVIGYKRPEANFPTLESLIAKIH
ncbi:bifunctional riboflavin kinase/FMN phosphatase-like isoform X1 [Macadamia integrifolia]|uniref:bifunctional riboflavin kinase/FMN phosphatase-like isoform X1 n=1 Tax=Macadamia integrifolia TaxID=60698 RepID=UPI001C4FE490|nr:bifunctional riboflavin kinase/FMN phosphatase-like isoform X1 [Macadamia integrifolia]